MMELAHTILLYLLLPLMLLLIIILLIIFCKPWRYLSPSSFRIRPLTGGDLERPLVSDEVGVLQYQGHNFERNDDVEGLHGQPEGLFSSPRNHGLVYKQRPPPAAPPLAQDASIVLDVTPDLSEHVFVGQTLKWQRQKNKAAQEEDLSKSKETSISVHNERLDKIGHKDVVNRGSSLTLEVISGPASGYRHTVKNTSKLPLTLGRTSPSDLSLKDSEVSGKHAMINWNLNKNKWELIDMGSLNGTLLNQLAVNHPDSGSRQWGDPVELANGDIITLGTTSNISVKIDSPTELKLPFDVGMVSDPMAVRRGGRKLPMEDVCYYQWPLHGADQFGLFGICDGHGGAAAAKSVSKILPEKIAGLLSDSARRDRVFSLHNASDLLKDAFYQTEANLNHHYEGCTATVLLVWTDDNDMFFAQCGNVGDSACIISIDGKLYKMSEDHRVTSLTERERIKQTGEALKDGETRLCGLNLARMLGDKFLKEQDARFSSEPYISEVLCIKRGANTFALLASDGFWDVIGAKKAIQLVAQAREKSSRDGDTSAEKIASFLLNEARKLRTKDNTSIIYLDLDTLRGSL
uniref:protein-serine/threonine phosphatase n=1 Tax=Kalanchoe fedtschenkoi TaxID=63787 RepID=A0A7N0TJX7_KALFE